MLVHELVSIVFWVLVALGLAVAANLISMADETATIAGRVAARSMSLRSDEWDRTPAAVRWYGLGLAAAALYVSGVLLAWRPLAGLALLLGLGAFAASIASRRPAGRRLRGWGDRLRVWHMAGWCGPFLVGLAGVLVAAGLGVK